MPFNLVSRESWTQGDVGHQIKCRREVLRQRSRGDRRRIHGTSGRQRCAEPRGLVGQLQGIARGCALVEHRGDEIGQPRLVGGVGVAAGPDHEARRNNRQPSALVENQRQPVRQRGGRGSGELKRPSRTCPGRFIAPGLVGIDRLALSLRRCRRRTWRRSLRRCRGLPGYRMHDDASIRREVLLRKREGGCRRHGTVAEDVLLEIVRRPEIVVVHVQPVGDAAKPAQPLEAADDAGLDRVARLLELGGRGRLRPEQGELLINGLLELLGGVTRARGGVDLKHGAEDQRVLTGRHVLGDLLFVDQFLEQAARSTAAKNGGHHLGVGVARLENRRGQPCHGDSRQLDAPGNHLPAFRGDRRRLSLDRRHRGTALQRAEVLFDQLLRRRDIDIADDRHACVVRGVELPEKPVHIDQLHRLDIFVRSDHAAVVRVPLREQRLHHALLRPGRTGRFSTFCRRSLRTTSC